MAPLLLWFIVTLVGAEASFLLGLHPLALWFVAAGSWATAQYDSGYINGKAARS